MPARFDGQNAGAVSPLSRLDDVRRADRKPARRLTGR
jgi:hypothetical protein